jgi:hypothetical protein
MDPETRKFFQAVLVTLALCALSGATITAVLATW